MTKEEVIESFEGLIKGDDPVEELETSIAEIQEAYQEAANAKRKEQLAEFVEAGGDTGAFSPEEDESDHRYKELINIYNDRLDAYKKEQKENQQANLETKQQIIEELKSLISAIVSGDTMAAVFEKFNELKEKWKTTGDVPARYYKQLQSDYSHQLDMFFYNVDIYRALKIHDFNKNLEAKQGLVAQVKELANEKSIKKVGDLLKQYQNEWSEIGPVKEEDWKELRNSFWEAVNANYERIQSHYDQLRDKLQANLEAKQAIIDQIKAFAAEDLESVKQWNDMAAKIDEFRDQWRRIGRAPHQDNERVWKEFKDVTNEFFKARKEYFGELKEQYKSVKEDKEALIAKAEELKDSTEWRETTEAFKQLQEDWKKLGTAGRDEQKLWKSFRAACDHFFEAKKTFFGSRGEREAANLQQKEELLKEMDALELGTDNEVNLAALKDFAEKWRAIGHVPKKKIDELNNAYKKRMDELYGKLKMDKQEKQIIRYKNKVEAISSTDQGDRKLDKEYRYIKDQIKKLKDSIHTYENNLSFFGHSKGANALKEQVEKNLEKDRAELATLEAKFKLLPQPEKPKYKAPPKQKQQNRRKRR